MFGLIEISGCFGLGRVWFASGQLRVNQFLVKYTCHAKTSNFVENFGSDMVRFRLIWVSGPLLGEHISGVGSGMGTGRSVRVSGFESVLPGLETCGFTLMILDKRQRKPILKDNHQSLAFTWEMEPLILCSHYLDLKS